MLLCNFRFVLFLFFLFPVSTTVTLRAQDTPSVPRVGLVLSGGGAKGFAHLGVIKVLEEEKIPIDFVGGTSMGSIVGGLLASGLTIDSIITIVREQDWTYILTDAIHRQDLSITEKYDRDRFMISLPLSRKGIELPAGIIRGQHIENLFHSLNAPVYDIMDFNKLPIPYLCVALDIDNTKEYVFHGGDLSDAMRASMSIPTAFEPMVIDGIRYVDGGLVDNFPVKHVMDMGADIIIGVDVGHIKNDEKKKKDMLSVMEDAVFYYSTIVREKNLKNVDVYINPDLHGLGVSSFTEADSLIKYGEIAAREALPKIRRLADSLHRLGRYPRDIVRPKHDSLYIKSIKLMGLNRIPVKLIKGSITFNVLEWATPEEVRQSAENLYATSYFDKVVFDLEPDGEGVRVIFRIREKQGGKMNVGLYYDTDFKTAISLNTTFLNLLMKGSKLSATVNIGKNPAADLYFFMDKGRILAPGIQVKSHLLEAYDYDEDRHRTASYKYFMTFVRVYLQSRFSNKWVIRLGGEMNHTSLSSKISEVNFGSIRDNFYGVYSEIYFDTQDRPIFPTEGSVFHANIKYLSNPRYHPIGHLSVDFRKAHSLSTKFSVVHQLFGGIVSGDTIPYQYNFWFGGQTAMTEFGNIPFAGYKFMEGDAEVMSFYHVDLQYKLLNNLFMSMNANVGARFFNMEDIPHNLHLISGIGATAGIITKIGPLRGSLSWSPEMKGVVGYFQLGFVF
jgi:NTE family protein